MRLQFNFLKRLNIVNRDTLGTAWIHAARRAFFFGTRC
jgi:hypothetical protein